MRPVRHDFGRTIDIYYRCEREGHIREASATQGAKKGEVEPFDPASLNSGPNKHAKALRDALAAHGKYST